jgi:peptidoglycan/xylan/chitin deacetylase (PgdA/CDA1 family)
MLPVSVVVWVNDRQGNLQACLDRLAGQSGDSGGFEIILVSAGNPAIDLARLSSSAPLRLLRAQGSDLGEAWNRGAEAAEGDVLLFIRDDFTAAPHLVAAHRVVHLERSDIIGLGKVKPVPEATGLSACLVEQLQESTGDPAAGDRAVSVLECAGQTLSLRRETFQAAGPFLTRLAWGTEVEMAFRLVQRRGVLLRLSEPVGQSHRPTNDGEIVTAAREAGASAVKLYHRRPDLLPHLELGAFQRGSPTGLWLRRLLLAMGGPGLPFGLIRRLLPRGTPTVRWNRFLLSYQYWRGVRQAVTDQAMWSSLTRGPVILMYHAVAAAGERAGCYLVPLRRFKRQMAWLRLAGYRVLTLEELLDCRREHRLPPGRSVVLSFDDGYADNRQLAFPVLQAHRFSAIFFVVTASIGGKNVWDESGELAGRSLLSWTDIREMLSAGMQVGAHTRHHVALPGIPLEEAEREIAGSRADLEHELGSRVRAFAYPYGLLDATTPDAVARAGFEGACCSRSGPNDAVVSSYLLRRLEVRGTDSLLQFIRALWRGHAVRRRNRE